MRARAATVPKARPKFTNRAAILVLVLAVLVVSYASSMRAYRQQRSDIDALKSQIASSQKAISSLRRERSRWQDPAYVETQARERFGWVMPGETGYQVIGADGKPLTKADALTNPDTVAQTVPNAWWSKAYGTLRSADHPRRAQPAPATKITPSSAETR